MVFKEVMLYSKFVKNAKLLLKVDELKSVAASNVNGAFDKSDGCESATKLVDLENYTLASQSDSQEHIYYPVNQGPVPYFNQERKLA